MDVLDYGRFALGNVGKRKKRTALTMLGIFIGIAAVVALVSLGQGLQQTVGKQFEKVGADKIIVQAKELGYGGQFAPGQLKERELDIVRRVNGVVVAAGQLFRSGQVVFNDVQRTSTVLSISKTQKEAELTQAVHTIEVDDGRLLTHKDKQKAVVGYNLGHKTLFGKDVRVGDKIVVNGETFDVVGVMKRVGEPTMDGAVILPEDDARRVLKEPEAFSMIVAQSARSEDPDAVAARIEKAIRRDRHQKEGKEDFTVQTSTDLIESFTMVLNIIQVVFIGIALISLLVGGIGIMNVMFTAVLERTPEIGVMKAIGARNRDILLLFLIESGLLGLAGGVIGVLIGMGISKGVEVGANAMFGPGTITAAFPWYLIIGALLFSLVIGAVSGVLPARRASRLKPVDALRYE